MDEEAVTSYHYSLIDYLKTNGYITTSLVEDAFLKVPRHIFLPDEPLDVVYSDIGINVRREDKLLPETSSTQPSVMAVTLELLKLDCAHRVMEIGAGTGYNAALMASIVGPSGKVVTIDIQPDVVLKARKNLLRAGYEWVKVIQGNGEYGYEDEAPYDRIILSLGANITSPAWLKQLAPEGRLVMPLGKGVQLAAAYERRGDKLESVSLKRLPNKLYNK